jgi:hypothetical protein
MHAALSSHYGGTFDAMSPSTTRVLLGAGFLAGAGCSTVLGVDPDRYVEDAAAADPDADSTSLRDGGRVYVDAASEAIGLSPWDCLASTNDTTPDPPLPVDATVVVFNPEFPSTALGSIDGGSDLDTVSATWLPGISVRQCTLLDTDCMDALETVVTDPNGRAEFSLTTDFSGFFDLRRSDLVPAALYPGRLVASQSTIEFPAYGITPAFLVELGQSANTTIDLAADGGVGHTAVTIYDCQDHQASDVSVTYDNLGPQSVPYYFSGGLPTTTETQTDSYGLAGAVNVPVGTLKISAMLAPNKGADAGAGATSVGSISVDIRPGSISYALIRARSR